MSFYLLVPRSATAIAVELRGDDAASEMETLHRLQLADAWSAKAAKADIEDQILKLRLLYAQMQETEVFDVVSVPNQSAV